MSMGSGKTMVEFFSAEMELSVCRYRSCGGDIRVTLTRTHAHALIHTQ